MTIVASVLSAHDKDFPCLVVEYQWQRGSQSLEIVIDITTINVIWPARVKVGIGDQDVNPLASMLDPNLKSDACIFTAWSDSFAPEASQAAARTERRLMLSNQRILSIWEGTGNSPTQNLRYYDHEFFVIDADQPYRRSGMVLLAYLDNVVAAKWDPVPELERKLAAAIFKKLNIVDIRSGCGIAGIGIAQLIPDCEVVIVDASEASAIIEANLERMFPAMSSNATFEHFDWQEAMSTKNLCKPMDLIFVADCEYDEKDIDYLGKLLAKLLARSPKIITIVSRDIQQASNSTITDIVAQSGSVLCRRITVPYSGMAHANQQGQRICSYLDIYQGKGPEHRAERPVSSGEEKISIHKHTNGAETPQAREHHISHAEWKYRRMHQQEPHMIHPAVKDS